jgi:TonB family protein
MKKTSLQIAILVIALMSVFSSVKAQDAADNDACDGVVYSGKDVSRKVRIISSPPPEVPKDSKAGDVRGTVVLNVVACHTGKITDIKVVTGVPYGWTEAAINAAKKLKFRPAEKGEVQVSQYIRLHYETLASMEEHSPR